MNFRNLTNCTNFILQISVIVITLLLHSTDGVHLTQEGQSYAHAAVSKAMAAVLQPKQYAEYYMVYPR